ncbi:MAG: hypothetical protein CNIPEHKO_00239 [Anaerolineales bacterium]|nr:hypothetical protein [Anaerolineales bacterium]
MVWESVDVLNVIATLRLRKTNTFLCDHYELLCESVCVINEQAFQNFDFDLRPFIVQA